MRAAWGGDELVVALVEMPLLTAELIAERIRLTVMQLEFREGDARFAVSVSIGIAECTSETRGAASLLRRADESLYEAKAAGKNCLRKSESFVYHV